MKRRFAAGMLALLCLFQPVRARPAAAEEEGDAPAQTEPAGPEPVEEPEGPQEETPPEEEPPDPEPEAPDALEAPEAEPEEGESTAIVSEAGGLKTALESDTVTHIYLAADIAMGSGGVSVSPNKPELYISGRDPETGQIHTLTDHISSDQGQTIGLRSGGQLDTITLEDLNLDGKNHYGPICIYDAAKNVHTVYRRVSYRGPQLIYNRYGTSRIENSTVEIGKFENTSDAGEVGEVGGVILAGTVSLSQSTKQANEIFYFATQGGGITVAPGASVTVSTFDESGFLYIEGESMAVDMEIGAGARFSFTGGQRFWEKYPLRSLTVAEEGKFLLQITGGTVPVAPLRVDGELGVAPGGWLHIRQSGSGTPALVVRSATFTDPESVLLVSPGSRTMYTNTPGARIDISAQQLNVWTGAGDGGLDGRTDYHWRNASGENLTVTGALASGTGDNWQSLSSNWSEGDPLGKYPLDAAAFNIAAARVVSFGRLELTGEYISPDAQYAAVSGLTGPGAQLRVEYEREGAELTRDGVAGTDGGYTVTLTDLPPDPHSALTVLAAWNYLYTWRVIGATAQILTFVDVPETLAFRTAAPSAGGQIIFREAPDWQIEVFDSRGTGSTWDLSARLVSPFVSAELGTDLGSALVFVPPSGGQREITPDQDTPIASHQTLSEQDTRVISWDADRGILLRLDPGQGLTGTVYDAEIQWILSDAP